MTRLRLLSAGGLVLFAAVICAILLVAKFGRDQNTAQARADCERASQRLVDYVNSARADQHANWIVATDPFQSRRTRNARAREVTAENTSIITDDLQIDRGLWSRLEAGGDRTIVRDGLYDKPPFRCDLAFPLTGLVP